MGDSDLAVKPATAPGEDMAAVLAAAGSMAAEANTAAASFLRTMEESGTAQKIRDASLAAFAVAKRIEEEFDRSGAKDLVLRSVAAAETASRALTRALGDSGVLAAMQKAADAERAFNERIVGKDLLPFFDDPLHEMHRLDRLLSPKRDALMSSCTFDVLDKLDRQLNPLRDPILDKLTARLGFEPDTYLQRRVVVPAPFAIIKRLRRRQVVRCPVCRSEGEGEFAPDGALEAFAPCECRRTAGMITRDVAEAELSQQRPVLTVLLGDRPASAGSGVPTAHLSVVPRESSESDEE